MIGEVSPGSGPRKFGESIRGALRKARSTISSTFLGTGSRTTGGSSEFPTAYLAWRGKFQKLTPLGIQFRRSRRLSTPSRPYLLEAIAGSGFDVGGFIAFAVFLVVVGVYLRMLWPTVLNAVSIFGIGHGSKTLHTSEVSVPTASNWKGSDNPLAAAVSTAGNFIGMLQYRMSASSHHRQAQAMRLSDR